MHKRPAFAQFTIYGYSHGVVAGGQGVAGKVTFLVGLELEVSVGIKAVEPNHGAWNRFAIGAIDVAVNHSKSGLGGNRSRERKH